MPHPRLCWFLTVLLLSLQHTLQDKEGVAEYCHEYCIQCGSGHQTSKAHFGGVLEVSLQVSAKGELPYAQLTLYNSITVMVNREIVTLRAGSTSSNLTLPASRPAFSWFSLILTRPTPDTLLIYTPEDKRKVLTANLKPGEFVFVSSTDRNQVAFNCITGCLIRDSTSSLVGVGKAALPPPFTMYIKPAPDSSAPLLVLTSGNTSRTVNATGWAKDRWHRLEVMVGDEEKQEKRGEGKEVTVWVPDGAYSISTLQELSWTLHCPPQEDALNPGHTQEPEDGRNTRKRTTTSTQTPEESTKEEGKDGEGEDGEGGGDGEGGQGNSSEKQTNRGAGAGEVAAWVLAGLSLFVVMILALALCTKTATQRNTHVQNLEDFPPSVGVLSYNDVKSREPEEGSEPDSEALSVAEITTPHKLY